MLSDELKTQIRNSFIALKSDMDGFQARGSQNKMMAEISKTLTGEYEKSNRILCVEAPTGTGKTFAYLLSSIPIAKANKKKLIVSSANVALQEQLLLKDLPEAQKYCAVDFEYTLVKGRSRYVCIRNLINLTEDNASNNSDLLFNEPPQAYQLKQMSELLEDYSAKQWNGEIDDLARTPDSTLWQKIACNRFTCTARNCEFYDECAFFKSRKKISHADVIVANHDLVLADLSTGNTVLPDVADSILIFDEAHHLNTKALSHFSLSTNTEFIKNSIRQAQGTSEQIAKLMEQEPIEIDIKQVDDYLQDLIELLKMLSFEEDVFLFNQGQIDDSIAKVSAQISTLITQILSRFAILKDTWTDYLRIQPVEKSIADPLNNAIGECEQHLIGIIELFSSFLQTDDASKSPHSRWISKNIANKKTNYSLHSAQTDISTNLDNLIWSKAAGCILTSATLSSLGSFDRLNQQLGLIKSDNQYLRLPSPFAFDQVDFVIAKFDAAPQQVYEHTQEVARQLLQRINANEGSLVLFASNKQMQLVADLVENKLEPHLLVQGEFSKKLILEKHINLRKKNQGSVIFGLDSFAEGVDLKGDNLTHVVIVKLRFSVPTSPIDKTLAGYLESQKRNPFMEISLPDASLKLIQACGRLIRTETDTGKITIFDNRLVTKFYGKQLLAALPNYNIVTE
ncbi:ATP-dependent helicase DinG/Rad3 [Bathymodiolus thermophilus thioautotrophic gill symbiont]|uniref:ATP-dependent DNA helicase DinG n=1 Tax=Bathymodiolus thermophilus thioautotrophic gill symbiont TaxID=2360 RepID=A0A1J5UHP2_9GAMM|nr:ATP-dependent DNA helicase DinG [Bathymodiolus thermophilus thioautotrophic gill symbiont]OIR25413.1 ATP-dependent DNA helicase DinG [Bathymodiolus thermophilus thioautotrophic gill symbiont]CAB5500403.1 ATP-dependent helicase DinG/Rad3 [Bathymodiolus thermophilus thioautotrophic gill symbiont]